jgi:hypothetical protein
MPKASEKTADPTLPLEGAAAPAQPAPSAGQELTAHEARPAGRLPATVSVASDPMAVLHLMERMARNKEVDTAKLGQIREFGEAILNDQRRAAFDAAFADMQNDLPTITARGTIEIREKDARGGRTGAVLQSTKYAKWEDINEAIKPVLHKHGFGLRFVTGLADDGRVKVTGILSGHGHREESVFVLPHDSTGSKNAVQAIGSSTSYGKRYAASALLNLTTRGEDDDANSFIDQDDRPKVSMKQIEELIELCDAKGCPRAKFLKHIGAESFKDIPAVDFDSHLSLINSYGPK